MGRCREEDSAAKEEAIYDERMPKGLKEGIGFVPIEAVDERVHADEDEVSSDGWNVGGWERSERGFIRLRIRIPAVCRCRHMLPMTN